MKKLVLIILVVIIAVFLYARKGTEPVVNVISTDNPTTEPDPSDATFIFDDGSITLRGGKAESDIAPDSAIKEDVELLDMKGYGDLNGDGKSDTAVYIVRSGGGSGVFIYVAAYISGTVSYKGTNAIFLGDRLSPESINIKNNILTVSYLDRSPDEPFAAEPTFKVTKSFSFRQGKLVEN